MPKGRPKGIPKSPNSGRKAGTQNKATLEIRELIQNRVDFPELIKKLEKRARERSELAARLLFEYGYGKPREQLSGGSTNHAQVAESFAQMVQTAGAGRASSRNTEVQE